MLAGKSSPTQNSFSGVAFLVLQKSLGAWHAGYSRRNPEIPVLTIQNISPSRMGSLGRFPGIGARGESRWKRGIRASLRFFGILMVPWFIAMAIPDLADPVGPSGNCLWAQKSSPASNQGDAEGPWRPPKKTSRAVVGIRGDETSAGV